MPARLVTFFRNRVTGAGISATVDVKHHGDDNPIVSHATTGVGTGAGKATFTRAEVGYRGAVYALMSSAGEIKEDSNMVINGVGPIWLDDLPDIYAVLGLGSFNGLAASADGTSMFVSVGAGKGVFKDGLPYVQDAAISVGPFASNATGNPRIDRLVLRTTRRDQTDEGKQELLIVQGTAAASPTPPNITQDAAHWDFSLAQVRINNGVSVITADKVTDERYSVSLGQGRPFLYPPNVQAGDLFIASAAGLLTRLPIGADGFVLGASGGLPVWLPGQTIFQPDSASAGSPSDNTSNTGTNTVLAFGSGIVLPTGTWVISARGDMEFKNDANAQVYFEMEVDGVMGGGKNLGMLSGTWQSGHTHIVSGSIVGPHTANVRLRFCSTATGVSNVRNPAVSIVATRTA